MSLRQRRASAIVLGSGFLLASALCFGQVQDVELKAAYIYNFALFTTWPGSALAGTSFDVCAKPDTPLWDSLQRLNGKSVDDRPWTVVDIESAIAGQCRIVVLSGAVSLPFLEVGGSALVIDDGSGGGASKAAITLVNEHEHIRFDVDTRKASSSGLSFSSKLLRLARNVS